MEKTIHSNYCDAFVEQIKSLRKQAGLSQRDFAELLEVPRSTVSRIEVGERRVDVVECYKIFQVLGAEPVPEAAKLFEEFQQVDRDLEKSQEPKVETETQEVDLDEQRELEEAQELLDQLQNSKREVKQDRTRQR